MSWGLIERAVAGVLLRFSGCCGNRRLWNPDCNLNCVTYVRSNQSSTKAIFNKSCKEITLRLLKSFFAALFLFAACGIAGATTVDFEQYANGTQITTQYQSVGATFENALQLTVPNYNYVGYPPHSGNGVVTNYPDANLSITFSLDQSVVTGWYNTGYILEISAYNSSNVLVASQTDPSNLGSSSEFTISGTDISTLVFNTSNGSAGFLTLDDVTFAAAVPEPGTIALLGTGLLGLAGAARRKFVS